MAMGLAAAAAIAAGHAALLQALGDGAGLAASGGHAQALVHLGDEVLLAVLLPGALLLALRTQPAAAQQLLRLRWDGGAALQTLAMCAAVFPLADPVLHALWEPVAQVGTAPRCPAAVRARLCAIEAAGAWRKAGGLHRCQ